jgi:hypothetical protein
MADHFDLGGARSLRRAEVAKPRHAARGADEQVHPPVGIPIHGPRHHSGSKPNRRAPRLYLGQPAETRCGPFSCRLDNLHMHGRRPAAAAAIAKGIGEGIGQPARRDAVVHGRGGGGERREGRAGMQEHAGAENGRVKAARNSRERGPACRERRGGIWAGGGRLSSKGKPNCARRFPNRACGLAFGWALGSADFGYDPFGVVTRTCRPLALEALSRPHGSGWLTGGV